MMTLEIWKTDIRFCESTPWANYFLPLPHFLKSLSILDNPCKLYCTNHKCLWQNKTHT